MELISEESISDSSSDDETRKWKTMPTTECPVIFPSNFSIDSSSSDDELTHFSNSQVGPFTLELFGQTSPTNLNDVPCTLDSAQVLSDSTTSTEDSQYLGQVSESETSGIESEEAQNLQTVPDTTEPVQDLRISNDSDSDTIEEFNHSNPLKQLLEVVQSNQPKLTYLPEDRGNSHHPPISNTISNETLYSWRRCLWPPLSPFYRILLRCKCVAMNDSLSSFSSERKRKRSNSQTSVYLSTPLTSEEIVFTQHYSLQWTDFWDPHCLESLPRTFDSVSEHNRIFYLLLLEECRTWMSNLPTFSSSMRDQDETIGCSGNLTQRQSWCSASIVSLSRFVECIRTDQNDLGTSDPRLGSLMIVQATILSSESSGPKDAINSTLWPEMSIDLRPGDLLLIKSTQLGLRVALGIVHGWDPDTDQFSGSARNSENSDDATNFRIVVCLCKASEQTNLVPNRELSLNKCHGIETDRSDAIRYMNSFGGWVQEGDIFQGALFDFVVIGNIITSSRECQALSSISSINQKLRKIILSPSRALAFPDFEQLPRNLHCPPGLSSSLWNALKSQYNESQLRAISVTCLPTDIQNDQSPSLLTHFPFLLLQGPPGTGKTHTILGIISALLLVGIPGDSMKRTGHRVVTIGASLSTKTVSTSPSQKVRILLCAPSNTAVDEIVERLILQGVLGENGRRRDKLSIVRIGQISDRQRYRKEGCRIRSEIHEVSLEHLIERRRRELETAQKSSFDGRGISSRIPGTIALRQMILEEADIVCCTLSGSGSPQLLESVMNASNSSSRPHSINFDVVIVDEAAQAVEPSSLIPFKYNPKEMIILVGDPLQLRAVTQSPHALKCGYGRSLFEVIVRPIDLTQFPFQRLNQAGYPMLMLETQYRMHPEIAYFPSQEFYHGKLQNDPRMAPIYRKNDRGFKGSHWKPYHDDPSRKYWPLVWHNFYSGREELVGTSYCNQKEADYILTLLLRFYDSYPEQCTNGIGIIAAYKAQQKYLKKIFREKFGQVKKSRGFDVEISTIDGFQGREMDIIVFSCVRTHSMNSRSAGIGFMSDWQRLNVGITRAKYGLWIVGDIRKLEDGGDVWRNLIEHCRRRRIVIQADCREETRVTR